MIYRALKRWFRTLRGKRRSGRRARSVVPSKDFRTLKALRAEAWQFANLLWNSRAGETIAVTCRGRRDGAGAQAMTALSAMAFTRATGCRYLHSPFEIMDHAMGDRAEWAQRWERFFAMGNGEEVVPADAELVPLTEFLADPNRYSGRPIVVHAPLFTVSPKDDRARRLTGQYAALQTGLRARYWSDAKAAIALHRGPPGALTVAVHVRRGDVMAHHRRRYVSDAANLTTIDQLQRMTAKLRRPLHINLFSEGSRDMFRAYEQAGCQLHLDTDTFETFHNLVTADILVVAPSAFSRYAAILSTGIVLAHPKDGGEQWIRLRRNGRFDPDALRQRLQRSD